MLRYITSTALMLLLVFTGCSDNSTEEVALATTTQTAFDTSMQLLPSDRIETAEKAFIEKLKVVLKAGDSAGFKKLYNLNNANPEYVAMIPYIFNKKWATHFDDLDISIEPNQKAKKYNTYFTIPYLGDLVIKSISGQSVGTTKVPVGIKDGVYYITIGAKSK